jgi:hypothetical protein
MARELAVRIELAMFGVVEETTLSSTWNSSMVIALAGLAHATHSETAAKRKLRYSFIVALMTVG